MSVEKRHAVAETQKDCPLNERRMKDWWFEPAAAVLIKDCFDNCGDLDNIRRMRDREMTKRDVVIV